MTFRNLAILAAAVGLLATPSASSAGTRAAYSVVEFSAGDDHRGYDGHSEGARGKLTKPLPRGLICAYQRANEHGRRTIENHSRVF